jgi:hypothetical protein
MGMASCARSNGNLTANTGSDPARCTTICNVYWTKASLRKVQRRQQTMTRGGAITGSQIWGGKFSLQRLHALKKCSNKQSLGCRDSGRERAEICDTYTSSFCDFTLDHSASALALRCWAFSMRHCKQKAHFA